MRRKNLKHLIDTVFSGRQADFAASAKKNPTQVNHWISGHRNPNGDTCREVEMALGYQPNWLDQDHSTVATSIHADQLHKEAQSLTPNQALAQESPMLPATDKEENLVQSLQFLARYLEVLDAGDRAEALRMVARLGNEPDKFASVASSIEGMAAAAFAKAQQKAA